MTIAALLFVLIATPSADGSGEPTLLDFHASWCGPCRQMRPGVEQLIQKGYQVRSIDIDESPELAERYHVTQVPTFVVVDTLGRPLARSQGAQPPARLAHLYLAAKTKANPTGSGRDRDRKDSDDDEPIEQSEPDAVADRATEPDDRPVPVNPNPWETVVRIKVHGSGMIGFGSGTIIHSTPDEAIILTCAHIFKLDGARQARPDQFPREITVDLFDGKLVGQQPATVHYANETYKGEALDYDFGRDVGLIRIRPGRRVPASRVVPASWQPEPKMKMLTVGCSEGRDATAWNTMIVNPTMKGLQGNQSYEAIECAIAPKQGRSGGGLYTTNGYVAGVCDFAEPRGNVGLYASPRSIHAILDRNQLTALYSPSDRRPETLLAGNRAQANPKPRRPTAPAIARAQSPDRDEAGVVTMPPPEMLNIQPPALAANSTRAGSRRQRGTWQPISRSTESDSTRSTDLQLPPDADNDRFGTFPEEDAPPSPSEATAPRTATTTGNGWRPGREALPAFSNRN